MILHDWDEARNRQLLRKCFAALPSGGSVIVSELLTDDKAGPAPAALISLTMLIATEGGRNYTAAEYSSWLAEAGFSDIWTARFDAAGANGAVLARKP